MKLNWFSPLPPAATDIAHFTTRVLPALSSRAEVTLWTDQTRIDPSIKQLANVRTFELGRIDWAELNRADACIYNIGNNPLFHGTIWQVSRQHAGIVILHDMRLHHFFDGLYRVQRYDLASYLNVMEFYYGERGVQDGADCFRNHARNIHEMVEKYPLTQHALENSLGLVVHTTEAFTELSADSSAPVAYLPLPFAASTNANDSRLLGTRAPRPHSEICRLIIFGYFAPNRRLEAVLQALHDMPERERFHLDVYGEILDDEKRIKAQIRELGLKRIVTLHGFAREEVLDEALSQSDLAINLRYPTMGEASGSQLRIWAHSLPSLVTKVGWYATLPTDAVVHVRADGTEPLAAASGSTSTAEVADIQSALRAFLDNPSRFAEMGQRGRRILEEQHSPESYAEGLIEFVAAARRHRPHAALFNLAERAGATTRELFGNAVVDEAFNDAAVQIRALGSRDS